MGYSGTLATVAVALLLSLVESAAAASTGEGVVRYRVGDASVWAVADSMGDRDMGVFQADPALVEKYAPGGKSPSAIMTFVVQSGGQTVLIDTGLGNPGGDRASNLLPGLKLAGIDPAAVDVVLITHMHGDHIGGLAWEGGRAFPNATIKIGVVERDFWLAEKSRREFPDRTANFDLAKRITDLYAGAVETFAFGDAVLPGFTALDSRGHTPGHTSFLFESKGEKLLFVGDILHSAALQFPHPEINARFDMIPEQAAAARKAALEQAAKDKLPIAGMHLPFPGVGRVDRESTKYRYVPGL